MDKNDLTIRIKNIGSIEDASFIVKDITGILGLPNSGKSYALRSIYWFLQLLDTNRYSEFKNILKKDVLYYNIINFVSTENNTDIENELKDKVSKYIDNVKLSKKLNEYDIYQGDLKLEFHLNRDILSKLIKNVFKKTMMEYLNANKLNLIGINGININKIIKEINSDIFKGKVNIFPGEKFESFYVPPKTQKNSSRYFEVIQVLTMHPIKMIINNTISNFMDDNISIDFNLELTSSTNPNGIFLRNLTRDEPGILFNDMNKDNQYMQSIISNISLNIRRYIIDFYLESIKSYISNISGLGSIKFIPYGRNIIVQLYNNSKSNGISAPRDVLAILQNLKNAPFSSYFRWLDSGSQSLDNFNENVKSFFQFIIRGNIDINTNSGGFKYEYSGDKYVDLNLSSAMVEEIAGLMLPIISSQEGDLILIEEPEAQLHITTQIIMGILLIYIVKEMNIKILFSTHSDTMTFIIQHILSNNIQDNDIKKLMKTIYNNNDVPALKLNMRNNKMAKKFSFYYISEGKSREYKSKDLQNSIPGISDVIDDLFNWAFNSLKDPDNGDKN